MNPQYIVNEHGERVAVVLPLAEFEALQEDLEDLAAVAERRDEPTLTQAEVEARLKADGLLTIEDRQLIVQVVKVGHRRDVYR